jgi:hypothetical protein
MASFHGHGLRHSDGDSYACIMPRSEDIFVVSVSWSNSEGRVSYLGFSESQNKDTGSHFPDD